VLVEAIALHQAWTHRIDGGSGGEVEAELVKE